MSAELNSDNIGQEIADKARKSIKYQIIVTVLVALAFALGFQNITHAIAALYGGAVSLILSWTLGWALMKASQIAKTDPKKGIMVVYISAVIRFVLIIGFFAIGIGALGLNPIPLVTAAILAWLAGVVIPHIGKNST